MSETKHTFKVTGKVKDEFTEIFVDAHSYLDAEKQAKAIGLFVVDIVLEDEVMQEEASTNMFDDFRNKVESFDPDLIAISLMENTFDLGMRLLDQIPGDIPIMAGGVFATYASDIVIKQEKINFVCRGEGEYPTLDLCIALANGVRTDNIPNIWAKDKHRIIKNS